MNIRITLTLLALALPAAARADIESGDLPRGTLWYLHADLAAMRDSDGGSKLYAWFEDEVGSEVAEETGIDIRREVDRVTAFAASGTGTTVVIEGPLTKETRDKLLAMAAVELDIDPREHDGRTYYLFGDEDDLEDDPDAPLDDLEDASFVSFAVDGKVIITGREEQMQELLETGGRITGAGAHDGALLVLSAQQALVQAGIKADEFGDAWESNIVRSTEQAALMVADASGRLAIEAELVSTDPKMTESIAGIVSGLIGLQAFNDELDPALKAVLRSTRVEVDGRFLKISTVVDPEAVMSALD